MTALADLAEHNDSVAQSISEAQSEVFRTIGFLSSPGSVDDIAECICGNLAEIKAKHGMVTAKPVRPPLRMQRPDTRAHEERIKMRPALEARLLAESQK